MRIQPHPTAVKLVELCQKGENLQAIDSLYSNDVISVEPAEMPGMERTMTGIEKIKGKNKWWLDNHQVHSSTVQGPFMHGNDKFALFFNIDVTPKAGPMAAKRIKLEEVGIYTLTNNKVTREEFFYTMG